MSAGTWPKFQSASPCPWIARSPPRCASLVDECRTGDCCGFTGSPVRIKSWRMSKINIFFTYDHDSVPLATGLNSAKSASGKPVPKKSGSDGVIAMRKGAKTSTLQSLHSNMHSPTAASQREMQYQVAGTIGRPVHSSKPSWSCRSGVPGGITWTTKHSGCCRRLPQDSKRSLCTPPFPA